MREIGLRLIVRKGFAGMICGASLLVAGQQAPTTSTNASPKTAAPGPAVQAPAPSRPAQMPAVGLESPWDVRKILADLVADNEKLKPLLAQMNPQQWYDQKGAPSTYITQWQTAQRQLNDVVVTTKMLSQKTEDLPLALDEYFRLEALEVTMHSLQEGAQHYADRATADNLAQILARNFSNRERFRDYIRDLATST